MNIKSVRGMQDILPQQKEIFRYIEDVMRDTLSSYGYEEIAFPHIESTDLFKRLVGETTDIVEKEMYTFDDRNGDSLSLRPEGTAGCVRYALQQGLIYNQTRRFWYSGAMFRHERPQKGRYRQFDQIGAECFGMPGPDIDAELLMMNHKMWRRLDIADQITLELNSLGSAENRKQYSAALKTYLADRIADLDEDSQRRLDSNPLRILDSKSEKTQAILKDAPQLPDFLDDESKADFEALCGYLDDNAIPYTVNPKIVRGLDYYNKTVFEWNTSALGAQGTVCGGGRYDSLVELLGGKPTEGIGFAMGLDRLALMLESGFAHKAAADIYIVSQGEGTRAKALSVGELLRTELAKKTELANKKVVVHCGAGKLKAQMKKADASGASLAIIIGESELAAAAAGVKSLHEQGDEQTQVPQKELAKYCADYFLKSR